MSTIYTLDGLGARTKMTARKAGLLEAWRGYGRIGRQQLRGLNADQARERAKNILTAARDSGDIVGIVLQGVQTTTREDRQQVIQFLILEAGSVLNAAEALQVTQALGRLLNEEKAAVNQERNKKVALAYGVASTLSMAVSAYHGSKRHGGSVGWGILWGAAGALFPIITPVVALAQGYGKRK